MGWGGDLFAQVEGQGSLRNLSPRPTHAMFHNRASPYCIRISGSGTTGYFLKYLLDEGISVQAEVRSSENKVISNRSL